MSYALAVAVISIIVASLATMALWQEKQRYRERASIATQNISRLLDQHFSDVIDKIDVVLQAAVLHYRDQPVQVRSDPEKLTAYLARQQALLPEITALLILDKDGIVRFGNKLPTGAPVNLKDRDYFIRARDNSTGTLLTTGPLVGRITQEWAIVFSRRITAADGSFAGVALVSLPTSHFAKAFSSIALGPNGAATIRTTDLALVHRHPDSKNAVGSKNVSRELSDRVQASPESGEYIAATALDGIERSNAYRKLQRYPFYVIVGLATDDYMGGWRNSVLMFSGLAGLAILVTCLGSLLVYRSDRRQLAEITSRKQTAAELTAANELLLIREDTLNKAHLLAKFGDWRWNVKTGEIITSDEIRWIYGREVPAFEEQRGTLLAVESWERVNAAVQETIRTGIGYDLELQVFHGNGSRLWVNAKCEAIRDERDEVVALHGTIQDITERKEAVDKALLERETRFQALFDQPAVGIALASLDGHWLQFNRKFCDIVGYERETLMGLTFKDITYPPDLLADRSLIEQVQAGILPGFSKEKRYVRQDGSLVWVNLTLTLMRTPTGEPDFRIAFVEEITQRKQAEEALRASEQRMRLATEATGVGIWERNLLTNRIHWDVEMFRIYGIAPTADGYVRYTDWSGAVLPEDLQRQEDILQDTARRQGHSKREFRVRHGADGELRHIAAVETVRTNAQGQAEWMVGTNLDITHRKRTEEQLRAAVLDAEQANHAKSRFLAAASHDLRQPLSALSLYAGLLSHRSPSEQKLVASMKDCIGSLSSLLTDLLDMSKLDACVVTPKIDDFPIAETLANLESANTPEAQVKGLQLRCLPSHLMAHSDPVLYRRILGNLVANAIRYTEHGGVLVACRRRHGKIWVEVWDTGIGIPSDKTAEIFEEFKQLGDQARNKGSGLGLAIVAKTAALLGLEINVRSRPGHGSVFAVELPLGQVAPVEPGFAPLAVARRALRIALVDDNAMVRTALDAGLQSLGHQVVAADSKGTLLDKLGTLAPDIVVSDYRLAQGETGFDVITAVRTQSGTELPAILITGDTDPNVVRSMTERGIVVLHKPLDLETLQKCVEDLTCQAMVGVN